MAIWIGRVRLDSPDMWEETTGDVVQRVGVVPVPGPRQGLSYRVSLPTLSADASENASRRLALRRQLRALLNNRVATLAGLWVEWDDDGEQNGWYVPDPGSIADAGAGLATGLFRFSFQLGLVGHPRTHRRGSAAYLRDRRLSTVPRDSLRLVYGTDFTGRTPLAVTTLGAVVSDVTVAGSVSAGVTARRQLREGQQVALQVNMPDLGVASFEQPDSARRLGDVVILDRRGVLTAPTSGPDVSWEEVHGPDQPLTPEPPVMENGLCRVRWAPTNTPGFALDAPTAGTWAEQGKMTFYRGDNTSGVYVDTFVSAQVMESSPERVVVLIVARASSDPFSREKIIVTLQRGWTGPRIELYTSPTSGSTSPGATLHWATPAVENTNAIQERSTGWVHAPLNASALIGTFDLEPHIAVIRPGMEYAVAFAVMRVTDTARAAPHATAYGVTTDGLRLIRTAGLSDGYVSAHVGLIRQGADASAQAEAFTLSPGTTSVADGAAQAGLSAQATRTVEADHVTRPTWCNALSGVYRVFARVRAPAAATLSIRANCVGTGAILTTTSTSFVWLNLGDVTANGTTTLALRAWLSAGAGTFAVDAIAAVKVTDQAVTTPLADGVRDHGRAALFDAQVRPTVVTRT